jgi:thiopurine S-methyltransferase
MDREFWLNKWQSKEIGFHQLSANPLLVQYFGELCVQQGSRVFLPLCGKSLDIAWLLANGYRVAGAELSDIAIDELFHELGIVPQIGDAGKLKHYHGANIDMFVGDVFDLGAAVLGPIDAIYDRAALVALPDNMRSRYANHLIDITHAARQFVICFEYDQTLMPGPPFSIDAREVERLYSEAYRLSCIASVDVDGGLKGVCPARESVWLLQNK